MGAVTEGDADGAGAAAESGQRAPAGALPRATGQEAAARCEPRLACIRCGRGVHLFAMSGHAGSAPAVVATSPDGAWYWDGSAWRSTLVSPGQAPPAYVLVPAFAPQVAPPGSSAWGRALRLLLLPLALVAEILVRGFSRVLSLVVGILSWGVTIVILVWLFHH